MNVERTHKRAMDRMQKLKEAIEDAKACAADAGLTSTTRRECRDELTWLRCTLVEEECRVERALGSGGAEGKNIEEKQEKRD